MRDYAKGIGERLRALRLERKLTQEQLSERADYDATYIGMVEHSKRFALELRLRLEWSASRWN